MSFKIRFKEIVEELPEKYAKPLAYIPFFFRVGFAYEKMKKEIKIYELRPDDQNKNLYENLYSLLSYSVKNVEFYRDFYKKVGFSVSDFGCLEDWQYVPIVTKADLQSTFLESRCVSRRKGMKINTGGTSGEPLEFKLDAHAFAREWAHMHHIWKAQGYRPEHLKLTFRGKHFNSSHALRYNAVHNEYVVNASCPMPKVLESVLRIPCSSVIRWVHGYPSLIAEFAHELSKHSVNEISFFRSRLFGVLLGSEYPAPVYRTIIEQMLSNNIVSWYGHSEMAVLARETAVGLYQSLPTYGYAESVPCEERSGHRLVCTSFHNLVHPFIRYDTGDLIDPVSEAGNSLSFRISEGRVGDFILDRNGNRQALTAIVFGRHHEAFELIRHIQVRDNGHGHITFIITPRDLTIEVSDLRRGFDLEDLDIDLEIEIVDEPIRTKSGKISLKIIC